MSKNSIGQERGRSMARTAKQYDPGDKRLRENIRLLQTGMWVGLILLQMLVVQGMEIHASAPGPEAENPAQQSSLLRRVYSENYLRKEDCREPEESYQTEDGQEYHLVFWEREPVTVPGRSRPVIREGLCEGADGLTEIPEKILAQVQEEGKSAEALCFLKEKRVIREEWQEGFSFPVIFHRYGSDFYRLGDQLIEGQKEDPGLTGREDLLLEEIGLTPEFYQITGLRWEGEPYQDEDGQICRKGVAYGQKLIRDYRLVYQGTAEFPPDEMWRVRADYEVVEKTEEEEEQQADRETEPVIVQTEETPAEAGESAEETLWQRITRTLLVTIAVGAVLFFGGLLLLAVLWGRRALLPYGRRRERGPGRQK